MKTTSETQTGSPESSDGIRLSVIIPCHNAADTIGDQLDAMARQAWDEPWELIVSNNRSNDHSMQVVERYRTQIRNLRVVQATARQGAAHALNVGVKASRGELLAFCDADDVVCDGWVSAMAEALRRNDFVSGPHEVNRLNTSDLQRNRGNAQPTGVQQYTNPPYLPHAGSGNMGIRRTVFDRIGGFDETMPVLYDTDFCWRVQLSGTALVPAKDAVLHVRYRGSVASLFRQAKSYGEWNVFIYRRYRPRGMPAANWKHGIRAWIDLFMKVRSFFSPTRRSEWIWNLGWSLGRLKGCIKYRVLAP